MVENINDKVLFLIVALAHRNEGCQGQNTRTGEVFIISIRYNCRFKLTMVSLYIADDMNKLKTNLKTKVQEIDHLRVSIKEKDNGSVYFCSFVFID